METNVVPVDQTMLVSWQKRLLNLVIDIIALILILVIIGLFAGVLALLGYDGLALWFGQMDSLTDRIVTTAVMVLYLFTMENFTQKTAGKYVTGTMVVMEDGSKPDSRACIIRALCRIIGLEALSFLGSYPRGWHDTASGTYVVDAKKYREAKELKTSIEEIGK